MKALPSFRLLAVLLAAGLLATADASACTVCMGASPQAGEAINNAIFFMLGMLGCMFLGIGSVAYSIWRRRHQPMPPQGPFTD